MTLGQKFFVLTITLLCIYMGWRLWDAPKALPNEYSFKIASVETHIDTLVKKYTVHDTVQKTLRAKSIEILKHDTIRDTICLEVVDTLLTALDECDSAKADRDSVISLHDTLISVVRDSSANRPDAKKMALTGLISALLTGFIVLFLTR